MRNQYQAKGFVCSFIGKFTFIPVNKFLFSNSRSKKRLQILSTFFSSNSTHQRNLVANKKTLACIHLSFESSTSKLCLNVVFTIKRSRTTGRPPPSLQKSFWAEEKSHCENWQVMASSSRRRPIALRISCISHDARATEREKKTRYYCGSEKFGKFIKLYCSQNNKYTLVLAICVSFSSRQTQKKN